MWLKTLINACLFLSFEQNFFDKHSYNVGFRQPNLIKCLSKGKVNSLHLITDSKYIIIGQMM